MSEPAFPERWKIVGSTSRVLFPVGLGIRVARPRPERFEFHVRREGKPEEKLFEGDFPEVTAPEVDPALAGDVEAGEGHRVRVAATLCPGAEGGPSFLCGQVTRPGPRIGDGATGVWVAEEDRPPRNPDGER